MFSRILSEGIKLYCWNTNPIFLLLNIVLSSLLRSFKLVFLIQAPPKSGMSRPPNMFISVVFPHPDVPTTAINSPSSTVNDTPSKARTSYVSDV